MVKLKPPFKLNMPSEQYYGAQAVGIGLALIALVALCYALAYLFVAGLTYLACIGFGFDWSWSLSAGVYAVCLLIRYVLSAVKSNS